MGISIHSRKAELYWNTVRYLRAPQILGRLKRLFHKPQIKLNVTGERSGQLVGTWQLPAKRASRMVGEQAFCFLNQAHSIQSSADWNNPQWEKLWLYNLHYFDDLTAIDAECRDSWHRALIQRWIEENPPGVGNGWEPYPTSLRIVNWIKWELAGNQLEGGWLNSLVMQAAWLKQNLETHLLGNHLFANAKALCFAGLFFEGDEADNWYRTGKRLIERELPEQVLDDGGNFELSTMYHLIFLEDLLDLVNLHRAYNRSSIEGVEERIVPMFHWLETMCHPDGEISFFNDAALGITPSVAEINDYGVRLRFLSLLGDQRHGRQDRILSDLPDSGYSRVEMGHAVALIDRAAVGPDYLPGHAHADTLSFELSLFGQRVIVNSGTSVYGTGEQRQLERGTALHSTVVIDGQDSSEVWGGFRVARRARVFNRETQQQGETVRLSACHDGYKRLSGKPLHCREWIFSEGDLSIQDSISGTGNHHFELVYPLHPDVGSVEVEDKCVVLDVSGAQVAIAFEGEGQLFCETSAYHPEFGKSVENYCLLFRGSGVLPINITTRIRW